MSEELIIEIMQKTLLITGKLCLPVLICIVVIGLASQIIQTVTQLKDQSLSFVPKMVLSVILMVLLIPWYLDAMRDYFAYIFNLITQARF